MKRLMCSFILLFAAACSQSPTAPSPIANQPPTQPGPTVIEVSWNVTAASCGPVAPPPAQPSLTSATSVQETGAGLNATWAYQSGSRPGILYARFVRENGVWALCSWDVADV